MDLTRLLDLVEDVPAQRQKLHGKGLVLLDAAKPYLIAALYRRWQCPVLVVTAQPEQAKKLAEQLAAWAGVSVGAYPEPDALPYERVTSDPATELDRLRVLSALAGCGTDENSGGPPLVVASAPALMTRAASFQDFAAACRVVKTGMEVEPYHLLRGWEAIGYQMEGVVEIPGTMSHRGGIVDVYPPTSGLPARLEFFGNTVESIRLFDPESQRSLEKMASISIAPATELLVPSESGEAGWAHILRSLDLTGLDMEMREQYEPEIAALLEGQRPHNRQFYASLFNQDSIFDYLPGDALLLLDEP